MPKPFSSSPYTKSPNGPSFDAAEITPADADLSRPARALYIGGAGDVTVRMLEGDQQTNVVFANVPAGTFMPIGVIQVRSSGTSATNIVGLFE